MPWCGANSRFANVAPDAKWEQNGKMWRNGNISGNENLMLSRISRSGSVLAFVFPSFTELGNLLILLCFYSAYLGVLLGYIRQNCPQH